METLDSDLLRTFLAITETGSFTAGAERIGRTQSAVSVQMKRLEALLGHRLFDRHGRGVVVNDEGQKLEVLARRIVSTLDGYTADLQGGEIAGKIRIGIPDDHSRLVLARIIATFTELHPMVDVVVQCAISERFPKALADGSLDLAVFDVGDVAEGQQVLQSEQLHWVAARNGGVQDRDPLPVAVFDRDCWWRDVALEALSRSGRRYRIMFTSESVTGVSAAIEAGAAIGLLAQSAIHPDWKILTEPSSFRAMPPSHLVLQSRPGSETKAMQAMSTAIKMAFQNRIA